MNLFESSMISVGALALLFLAAWVGYDEGKRQALRDLDEHIEVARALGAYGITLRLESARTGVAVDVLLERDGLDLSDELRAIVRRTGGAGRLP